ncbi:MAG: quinone-dependent dihydroorotate dehydrogenase [Verrucomicrobiota bacterium]
MSWFYRNCVRPILFTQDSERIHHRTLKTLGWASGHQSVCALAEKIYRAPDLPVESFGLKFPNPVGLAAGMDKQAAAVPIWEKLGFGFCELGGVTWHAQPGNLPPRMFRAIDDEALINRMGFNNPGAEALAAKLSDWKKLGRWPAHPVGINLGKSKVTPLDRAAGDYANSFRILRDLADFFVVNVSSPNTPNLRQLQDKAALDEILAAVQVINVAAPNVSAADFPSSRSAAFARGAATPILVKIAPDLSFDAIDEILELVSARKISGIVATNTTVARPQTSDTKLAKIYLETGGLSGRPLRNRSNEIIRHIYKQTRGTLPVIGVGGIFDADDAFAKILAGASLIQIYTGLVYEGPAIAKSIVAGLQKHLAEQGFADLKSAVGAGVH